MSGKRKETYLLTKQEPNSIVTEAYRTIRASMRYGIAEQNRKVILFSSPLSGEGKTTAVANLGYLFAQDGMKTLLVDGDLRRPNLHHIFRLPNRTGLSSYLSGYCSINEIIHPTEVSNLELVPAGPIQPNPSELLGNFQITEFIDHVKSSYDLILVDSAPLLVVSDPAVLARVVDGVVIIIRALKTQREDIVKSQKLLEPLKDKVLGFIMNDKTES
jgi:protein-tyrosine kinase